MTRYAHDSRRKSSRPVRSALTPDPLWYKDAVIYEVRTRSFFDSNGDGVGDLRGLTSKLDYLADLGVTALWLLPHYPSPGRDDGYDIADYCDIHPDVGTLEDFDELVEEAHRRGLRVITELVLNHTSDQHAWFQRARRAPPGSPERDFYVWSDRPDRYKEARIIFRDFEPSNWTWDSVAGAYFWHRFFAHQPDLNFENPEVHAAMYRVVDFWLSRGVDGLRLDAVPYLYESEGTNCENLPATHEFLKRLRKHVDEKFEGRMLLAEANQWPEDAARYFGEGDECHMNFHFPIMPRLFMSIHMEDRFPIIDILRQTPELHENCQWAMFLRNHDELTLEMVTDEERDYMYRAYADDTQMRLNLGIRRRLAPLVGNDRRKMELLNGLLFSMPGTPVLYYGDEIGMGDNVYLGDRNGVRTPMQWSADRNAGFSRANPQRLVLPINIDPEYHYEALNVEAQQQNANSLLWWTKRLVALRKKYRAFGRGTVEFLHPSNPRVLAFIRQHEDETILVVANLSRHVQYVELDLASRKGSTPVELFGRTRFPCVGELPYLLALGGYDFYWFRLEPPRESAREERLSMHGPQVLACTSADELLFGSERGRLESVLASYLDARGLLSGHASQVTVQDAVAVGEEDPIVFVFARVEYDEGEAETFSLPLRVIEPRVSLPGSAPVATGPVVAQLATAEAPAGQYTLLVEETAEHASRRLVDVVARGVRARGARGEMMGELDTDARSLTAETGAPTTLSTDRLGVTVALGTTSVVRMFARMEEGVAPEVEIGRSFAKRGVADVTPRVLGQVVYRVGRAEPVTMAIVEERVINEGTAWQQARREIERAYERVLANALGEGPPAVPREPLLELAYMEPPEAHAQLMGAYRDWAHRLGRRTAELHLALSAPGERAFEPEPYSTMDQRSKYQTARNLVGRTLAALRRTELPAEVRPLADRVIAAEDAILARFEPLLQHRLDTMRVRVHGELHLGRVLFTGKDYLLTGLGGGRERRLSERRRKGAALRDVASMVRSFHWAAATSLTALRPEDQARGAPWAWIWQRWAAAAYVAGYLELAKNGPFVPKSPATASMLLETTMLERAFAELRIEMRRRPDMTAIPLQGILRIMNLD